MFKDSHQHRLSQDCWNSNGRGMGESRVACLQNMILHDANHVRVIIWLRKLFSLNVYIPCFLVFLKVSNYSVNGRFIFLSKVLFHKPNKWVIDSDIFENLCCMSLLNLFP